MLPLLWLAYWLVMAVWIVLQKRSPLATLAWLLGLAALPILGFVVYFYLGPQRIRRQRLRRRRLRQMHHCTARGDPQRAAALPRRKRGLGDLIANATGAPVSSVERIDLFSRGSECFDAIVTAIASAQRHVHLEYYIFEPDAVGHRIRDALVERAAAGVKVRVLLDAVGSPRARRRFWAPLRAVGGEVVLFHPFRLATLRPLLNLRSHRKIVVVDGSVGFCGGMNISAAQDERHPPEAWRDLHVRLQGLAVGWLQAVFAEDWQYARRRPLAEAELYPDLARGPVAVQVVASGPDSETEAIHRAFLQAIADSRERVWLVTPYFVPGDAALYALGNAALRGVDVRLLLPSRSDSRIVAAAARSYYDELLAHGVKIFEYQPQLLHSKLLLVDRDCAILGTANFDLRSFRLNFEVALAVYDEAFNTRCSSEVEADLQQARRITQPRRLGPLQSLGEAAARLLSPVL